CILACCLGSMRRQLEQCIDYARTRKQFGQAIGKFQSVANRIVELRDGELVLYRGDYAYYLEKKEEERAAAKEKELAAEREAKRKANKEKQKARDARRKKAA
ncbi:MAG: acyl-CoA dehydrogenase family protein, partial [Synechococcus sp.]